MAGTLPLQYQNADEGYVDYQMWLLDGTKNLWFRGPKPELNFVEPTVVCLGAAQTFGRFNTKPYPHLLHERLARPIVNLGYAGAGPFFYLCRPDLIAFINRASHVIIQVMSGRSTNISQFSIDFGPESPLTGRARGYLRSDPERKLVKADDWVKEVFRNEGLEAALSITNEMQANWVRDMTQLLTAIRPPKTLFWFSVREIDDVQKPKKDRFLLSNFPQIVNRTMMDTIQPLADQLVSVVSTDGLPQDVPPLDPASGLPSRNNKYYPSPQMHRKAADALVPALTGGTA